MERIILDETTPIRVFRDVMNNRKALLKKDIKVVIRGKHEKT